MINEPGRIVFCRPERSRIVQQANDRPRVLCSRQPGESALPSLAGTVDQDDASVSQRVCQRALGLAGNQVTGLSHLFILSYFQDQW